MVPYPGSALYCNLMKQGIKVSDLAKELGTTSRQLIDRCRAEGVAVQNSITKLRPDQERRVRGWFAKPQTDEGHAPPTEGCGPGGKPLGPDAAGTATPGWAEPGSG